MNTRAPVFRITEWFSNRRASRSVRPEENQACVTCGRGVESFEGVWRADWKAVACSTECENVEHASRSW